MYKFTNGVVVYDEATRDKYVKAGMTLIKEEPQKKEEKENGKKNIQSKVEPTEYRRPAKRTSRFGKSTK